MVIGILVALSGRYDKRAEGDMYSRCSRRGEGGWLNAKGLLRAKILRVVSKSDASTWTWTRTVGIIGRLWGL